MGYENSGINQIVKEFRAKAEKLYGDRLKGIILYGSWARGEALQNSGIDLLIILEGEVNPSRG